MANNGDGNFDPSIDELWIALDREEKKKICNALIDHDQPDVVQKFASLIQLTQCYQSEPTGSDPSSKQTPTTPDSRNMGAKLFESETEKRKDDWVLVDVNTPTEKESIFSSKPSDEDIQFDENDARQGGTVKGLSGLMRSDVSAEVTEGMDEGQTELAGEDSLILWVEKALSDEAWGDAEGR